MRGLSLRQRASQEASQKADLPRSGRQSLAIGLCSCVVVLAGLCTPLTSAFARFQVPALTGPVVDEARILDASVENAIGDALRALNRESGTQINVLTVPSLEGLSIEQASIQVTDTWRLGGAETDKGVLLMVAPNERKIRIEVGQGVEGVLTDVESKRIIDESVLPLFRAGDFTSGVIVGVFQIARQTDPGVDLTPYLEGRMSAVRGTGENRGIPLGVLLFGLFLFLLMKGLGGGQTRRLHRSVDSGGMVGGFGGGGFGGGGFGGGGWGGGGGGFSGGGASGGW